MGANVTIVDIVNRILGTQLPWDLNCLIYGCQREFGLADKMSNYLPIVKLSFPTFAM